MPPKKYISKKNKPKNKNNAVIRERIMVILSSFLGCFVLGSVIYFGISYTQLNKTNSKMQGNDFFYKTTNLESSSETQEEDTAEQFAEEIKVEIIPDSYMIYYGALDDDIIEEAKQYEVVILHPKSGNITREQVEKIQANGTIVLGYISIGEDLRTSGMTPEEMLADPRFVGDGSGPRVDPREPDATNFDDMDLLGIESPGGTGFASYYLDDNNFDGLPDVNAFFNCAFTNPGDPEWFEILENMTLDGIDNTPGIKEILTHDYGRGLGCDGLFLDTIDTCAPNYFSDSDEDNINKSRFEWTAPGFSSFMERLKEKYPEKLVLQNRGMFFYDPRLPHYKYSPGEFIDYLMVESYMLDSNQTTLYSEIFHDDNKYNYAPKIMAEAGRPNGFKVLSLGYAEGPEKYELKETLIGESNKGYDVFMEDIKQAQNVGYSHYITDAGITIVNDFVIKNQEKIDSDAPVWSSVYNDSSIWPPAPPEPRVGIGQVEPVKQGVIVRWDIAFDRNDVNYTLYYQKSPFDFDIDPDLENAEQVVLIPEMGDLYDEYMSPDIYPYQATINNLGAGEEYYFIIRAKDSSPLGNEEKNTEVKAGIPLNN